MYQRHKDAACIPLVEQEAAAASAKGYGVRRGKTDVLPLVNQILLDTGGLPACSESMRVYRSYERAHAVMWAGNVVFYARGNRIETSKNVNTWFNHLERLAVVVSDKTHFG